MHFKHHNGTFRDFNSRNDEENFLSTDMTSHVRSGISLKRNTFKQNIR